MRARRDDVAMRPLLAAVSNATVIKPDSGVASLVHPIAY
jgi:hypothetical protein